MEIHGGGPESPQCPLLSINNKDLNGFNSASERFRMIWLSLFGFIISSCLPVLKKPIGMLFRDVWLKKTSPEDDFKSLYSKVF